MAQTAKGKLVGDALLAYLDSLSAIQALGVSAAAGTLRWAKGANNEPLYPADAVADLPDLRLREYVEATGPGNFRGSSSQGVSGTQTPPIRYSLWYRRRQVPGQPHHELLIADLEAIVNVFLGNWQPPSVMAAVNASGGTLYGIYTQQPVVHDDLEHEFGEPRLRVSVGEVPLEARVQILG